MNTEKLKYLCTRFAHECRLKGVVTNNETIELFDEWIKNIHPDLADTETTERVNNYPIDYTKCCRAYVLGDETVCPSCGRRIKK